VVLRDFVGGDNVVGGDVLGSNGVVRHNVVGGHVLLRDGVVGDNVVGSNVLDRGLSDVFGGVGVCNLVRGGGVLLARVVLGGDLFTLASLGEGGRARRGDAVVSVTEEVVDGAVLDRNGSSAEAAVAG